MCNVTTLNQGGQEEVWTKLFEAVEIVVPVIDDACEEPAL